MDLLLNTIGARTRHLLELDGATVHRAQRENGTWGTVSVSWKPVQVSDADINEYRDWIESPEQGKAVRAYNRSLLLETRNGDRFLLLASEDPQYTSLYCLYDKERDW